MKKETISGALAAVEEGIREGLHLGAQLYVSREFEVIANLAVGQRTTGIPLQPDMLLPWMSSGKPVTAVALAMLWERGLLDLDDPIARHVPEFAAQGKDSVKIRHALTHTGGFRMLDTGWPKLSWEEIVARICDAKLEPRWTPGRQAGYHRASSWFLLGEVVQRLSGVSFSRFVREKIFQPLGMDDSWIGMPAAAYSAYGGRIGQMFDTAGERAEPLPWTSEDWAAAVSPAQGALGPAQNLGRFYEMLLNKGELGGTRLLRPQTVEALLARHRTGMYDRTFRHALDWGLGFIPDNKHHGVETVPYGYGRHCSSSTCGHSGYRSSTGFVDRENRLAVALIFNGAPSDEAHAGRARRTLDALYEDLGLGGRE